MSEEKHSCDLCGLPVEIPGFRLLAKEGIKRFCCEGCLGIYRILHEEERVDQEKTSKASDSD